MAVNVIFIKETKAGSILKIVREKKLISTVRYPGRKNVARGPNGARRLDASRLGASRLDARRLNARRLNESARTELARVRINARLEGNSSSRIEMPQPVGVTIATPKRNDLNIDPIHFKDHLASRFLFPLRKRIRYRLVFIIPVAAGRSVHDEICSGWAWTLFA